MKPGDRVIEAGTECSPSIHREDYTACFNKFGRVVLMFRDRVSCWVVNSDAMTAEAARIETRHLRHVGG